MLSSGVLSVRLVGFLASVVPYGLESVNVAQSAAGTVRPLDSPRVSVEVSARLVCSVLMVCRSVVSLAVSAPFWLAFSCGGVRVVAV